MANIIQWGKKYIDYRMAIFGGFFMAFLVFGINYHETGNNSGIPNISGSITAALKQGVFTFFFGGFIMRLSERLAIGISERIWALISACIVPSTISIVLTFVIHILKGTPEPMKSVIPTILLIIPGTAFWGYLQRRKLDAKK